jgi:hypothetical protein
MAGIIINDIPKPGKGRIGSWDFDEPHKREPHEIETVKRLVLFGDDILFLKPSKIKGEHTPDILWRNGKWEIKAPNCNSKENVVRAVKDARKQSNNIILDITTNDINRAVFYIHYYFGTDKWSPVTIFLISNKNYCVIRRDLI